VKLFHSSAVKLLTAAAAILFLQNSRALAGDQDFELHNKTGVEINEVYVSPHSSDNWEEDVLGKDTLAPDDSVEIKFSPKEDADYWDIKVTDGQGGSITWENLKLTEITDVFLYYKNGKATAETKNGD
jgi:hypothetical protein